MDTKMETTAEVFWLAFNGLPRKQKQLVIGHMIRDKKTRHDLIDLALMEERRDDPARPLREYLKSRPKQN